MRSAVLVTIMTLSCSRLGEAGDPPIAIFSYEDTSCGAWAKSADDKIARAQYDSWFRGFVSGHNFADPVNQIGLEKMPNPATLALYVDKYCRENPLNPFVSAAFELVRELGGHGSKSGRKTERK